ncbi:MAG: hypothetical protein JWO62_3370 [Acidimicrobiaceae bacterium]|nr:hypothetical protein [Acidimicrobiaceae bacterium]
MKRAASDRQRAASDPPGARARARRLAAPGAVAVLVALALGGCSSYTGSHGHQVAQWASGASLATNDGFITTDVREISSGIALRKLVATRTACDGLATDAGTAYGQLPTPDRALTNDLASAYLDYIKAAQDCTSASSFDGPAFDRYRRVAATATAAFDAAKRRLKALGVA